MRGRSRGLCGEPCRVRRRPGVPGFGPLTLLILGLVAACDRGDAGPFALAPCSLGEEPTISLDISHISRASDLRPALVDAVERAALALPEGNLRSELRNALRHLSTTLGGGDTTCRLKVLSNRALARLEGLDDPGSLPDRAVIRLTLDLTRAALGPR